MKKKNYLHIGLSPVDLKEWFTFVPTLKETAEKGLDGPSFSVASNFMVASLHDGVANSVVVISI